MGFNDLFNLEVPLILGTLIFISSFNFMLNGVYYIGAWTIHIKFIFSE